MSKSTTSFKKISSITIFILVLLTLTIPFSSYGYGIFDIQYNESSEGVYPDCFPSPRKGEIVHIAGTVTAVFIDGSKCNFFLQEKASPWHGILVEGLDYDIFKPAKWDSVSLYGTVEEENGMTIITSISGPQIVGWGSVQPPLRVRARDLDGGCSAKRESYEGMFVRIDDVNVTETEVSGKWYVTDDGGVSLAGINDFMHHFHASVGDEFDAILGIVTFDDDEYFISPETENDILETRLFPGEAGEELLNDLETYFKPWHVLSYDDARDKLYSEIDNRDDSLTCVYTGYTIYVPYGCSNPRYYTNKARPIMNAEHTWPKAKCGNPSEGEQRHNDMHHLYPTNGDANAARSSYPFDEIPDYKTDRWWRGETWSSGIPGSLIDEYSEEDIDSRFEPREDHKGNVARSMFYFETMYHEYTDEYFFEEQKRVLLSWNSLDPVDQRERDRSSAIALYQSGKENPFVIDPTLVRRAFFQEMEAVNDDGDNASSEGSNMIQNNILNNRPNPFNPLTTIDFRLDNPGRTRLSVFDIQGKLICVLADGEMQPGVHSFIWNGKTNTGVTAPSGIYIAVLRTIDHEYSHKLLLLK